jgi:hypothetical protein
MEPREAARVLAQTQADARRSLDFRAPWVSLVAAVVVLAGFGIVWLDVRNQHPFTGPSPASLVFFYGLIALRIATVIYAYARARTGISGHSVKVQRSEAAVMGAALLVCYLALIAIANSGSHHGAGFYWSLFLNGTLIALAAIWAGRSAIHKSWQQVVLAVAVALIAAAGAIADPRGMWLVTGVGLCVLMLANAAIGMWQRRGTRTHRVRTGA